MADAVGASSAFFSTCGISLSVRAAMMAVAGGADTGLPVPQDSHESIAGGLIFSGIQPRWITPRWDIERELITPTRPGSPPWCRASGSTKSSSNIYGRAFEPGWRCPTPPTNSLSISGSLPELRRRQRPALGRWGSRWR
jgi:hypothetical protein